MNECNFAVITDSRRNFSEYKRTTTTLIESIEKSLNIKINLVMVEKAEMVIGRRWIGYVALYSKNYCIDYNRIIALVSQRLI